MKNLLLSLLALPVLGCAPQAEDAPKNLLAHNDFETIEGWTGGTDLPGLTKEKAHSGEYSGKVGPETEYSPGYNNQLSRLSPEKLRKIKVRAWVSAVDTGSKVLLVTEVKDPNSTGKAMLWEGLDLAKAVTKANEWVPVETVVTIPDEAKHSDRISVYLWRSARSQPVYLDDLEILREE